MDINLILTAILSVGMLTIMEIVLGIDNIIFIGIVANDLPNKDQSNLARKIGMFLALIVRIIMLSFITYLAHLVEPLFTINITSTLVNLKHTVTIRDVILLFGGLFLIYKTLGELHEHFDTSHDDEAKSSSNSKFLWVIMNIVLIDIVFSFDSILTAVGLVENVGYMIAGVVISMTIMFFLSGKISEFIEKRPTLKLLALMFLMVIGCMLIGEGTGFEVPKGTVYFGMAFALIMEFLNNFRDIKQNKVKRTIRKKQII